METDRETTDHGAIADSQPIDEPPISDSASSGSSALEDSFQEATSALASKPQPDDGTSNALEADDDAAFTPNEEDSRTTPIDPSGPEEESISDAEEDDLTRQLEASRGRLDEHLAEAHRLRREQYRLRARRDKSRERLQDVDDDLEKYRLAQDDLREWMGSRSRSFAWRLLEALKREEANLEKDWIQLQEAIEQPVSMTTESPSRLQDRFMYGVIAALTSVTGVFGIVTLLKYRYPPLQSWESLLNPFYIPTWALALVAAGLFALIWILLAINYYRRSSERRQRLSLARHHVDSLAATVEAIREEKQRVTALHSQVPDYLKFLSEITNRPWLPPPVQGSPAQYSVSLSTIPTPESIVFESETPHTSSLPAYIRLSSVPELTGDAKETALVRDSLHHVLRPGWRTDALNALIEQVEIAISMPRGALSLNRLDRNPRLREIFLSALAETDAHQRSGLEVLKTLAHQIQELVLNEVHPPVRSITPDPLDGLALNTDVLEPVSRGPVDWDSFLTQSLAESDSWSPAVFSPDGRAQIPVVRSVGYGPDRIADLVDPEIEYRSITERTARPIEMTIRLDRTERALSPALFAALTREGEEGAQRETDTQDPRSSAEDPEGVAPTWDDHL